MSATPRLRDRLGPPSSHTDVGSGSDESGPALAVGGREAAIDCIKPPARGPGRPRSPELSRELLATATGILATEGWSKLTSQRLVTQARVGKAGIYRRWRSMSELAKDAVTQSTFVPTLPDSGSDRDDLLAMVASWAQPLSPAERAVGSLLGASLHDDVLHQALVEVLSDPLLDVVSQLADRQLLRGAELPVGRRELMATVLRALWLNRLVCLETSPGPGDVETLVDDLLLPLMRP